jgi:GNAT superfamily N-acetyltransferase
MPSKSTSSRGSRSELLIIKAKQVEDPLSDLQNLLCFSVKAHNLKSSLAEKSSGPHQEDCFSTRSKDQGSCEDTNSPTTQNAEKNDIILSFKFEHLKSSAHMISSGFMVWAFELIKSSLKALYEPVWGWDDSKKMAQLQAASSRFIVAITEKNTERQTPAAFINYRLESYDGSPACYLYEVMVDPSYQRLGLGAHMMGLVENMAWRLGMDRCVLTEFKANKAATVFYHKLGYKMDPTNPSSSTCGYMILSKTRPGSNALKTK